MALTMKTVNMHEAKTHLSRLVDRVAKGEKIIIGKAGKPVAVLSPFKPEPSPRRPGSLKGRVWISEAFDEDNDRIADFFDGAKDEA